MNGASPPTSLIPEARNDDDDDVAWALQTAAVQWKLGGRNEAVEWLRRAAEAAAEAGAYSRARELNAAATALEHAASLCADVDNEDYDGAEPILEIGEEPMLEPGSKPVVSDGRPEMPTLVEDEPAQSSATREDQPGQRLAVLHPPPKVRAPAPQRRPPPVRRAESSAAAADLPLPAPTPVSPSGSPGPSPSLSGGLAVQALLSPSGGNPPQAPPRPPPPRRLGRVSSLPPITRPGGIAVEPEARSVRSGSSLGPTASPEPDGELPSRPPPELSGALDRAEDARGSVDRISVDYSLFQSEERESIELLDLEDAEELPVDNPGPSAGAVRATDLWSARQPSEPAAADQGERPLSEASAEAEAPPSEPELPSVPSWQPPLSLSLPPEEPTVAEHVPPNLVESVSAEAADSSSPPDSPASASASASASEAAPDLEEPVSAPAPKIPSWAALEGSEPPTLTRYRPSPKEKEAAEPAEVAVGGVPLADARGLQDLPDDAQQRLARSARLQTLEEGEEVAFFAVALVVRGWVQIMPAIMDIPCARASKGEVVFTTGTLEEGIDLSVRSGEANTVVAVWDRAALQEATTDCPWVADELRLVADGLQALAGASVGALGERLDDTLRSMVTERCEVRTLAAGEVIVQKGQQVRSMHIVGAGRVELLSETGEVETEILPGSFLFAAQVLSAGAAPKTARVGRTGAVLLVADRKVAHELMVSVPPLLELLADE